MRKLPRAAALSRLLTLPARHIRWKIILPYAFLTVVLAVAGSYIATGLVTGSLAERFDNQLAEAGRVVADAVVRKERDHLETVRAVAFTEGVADAVEAGDGATVKELVEPIASNAGVERLEVLDIGGQRLNTFSLADEELHLYQELSDDDNPATWPLVQKVLRGDVDALGDKYAQVVETSDGFVLYTAGPISDDRELVGVVLVGTDLDSFDSWVGQVVAGDQVGATTVFFPMLRVEKVFVDTASGAAPSLGEQFQRRVGRSVLEYFGCVS